MSKPALNSKGWFEHGLAGCCKRNGRYLVCKVKQQDKSYKYRSYRLKNAYDYRIFGPPDDTEEEAMARCERDEKLNEGKVNGKRS